MRTVQSAFSPVNHPRRAATARPLSDLRSHRESGHSHVVDITLGAIGHVLPLDSPTWAKLQHAYGNAGDIPALLSELGTLPSSAGNKEPWHTIWSSLAHQGDVYSASFAAVPHVVAALASSPTNADFSYFQFPAWVEICRAKNGTSVPAELELAYFQALRQLPALAAAAAKRLREPGYLACALSAIAASAGQAAIAEAVLELVSSEKADEFLKWHSSR